MKRASDRKRADARSYAPEPGNWQLLDSNEDALRYRLALVDPATTSLDIQYYFWWESARVAKSAAKLQERRVLGRLASRIPVGTTERQAVGFPKVAASAFFFAFTSWNRWFSSQRPSEPIQPTKACPCTECERSR